ncbi:MAG: hypothetical protein ABIH90_02755 [Candidatus Aenigmatarchaeota archaeon]
MKPILIAVVIVAAVLLLLLYSGDFLQTGCPRRTYRDPSSYMEWLRSQGFECSVIESTKTIGGVPEGCDDSNVVRTLFISCKGNVTTYRTAYETEDGGVMEFTQAESAESVNNANKNAAEVSEDCYYLVFDEPFGYADKQEMAGFSCDEVNTTTNVYDITLICREFMQTEAQRDAGLELTKTTYFNCSFDDGKNNLFPVYETADGRYVFFGELK